MDKQWSTKHTHKTEYQVTRTLLKTGSELRCSGSIANSCSTSGTRRVNPVTRNVSYYLLSDLQELFNSNRCIWFLFQLSVTFLSFTIFLFVHTKRNLLHTRYLDVGTSCLSTNMYFAVIVEQHLHGCIGIK
jgi:hypothetical protein